ncbi:aspartic peptidase domain-containing protein [Tricharina praecox]|uniref:aspartic peptidase domain-containing protein n=1 Tax=Tricharina praecox TaxID=43433 RepID=UPI00221F6C8F|nr:aspartic peptidase domain-containing protein [Tricharina praecox]KAI5855825.1 aspartic peptidase domain-containing protein [Tricharina praecox]
MLPLLRKTPTICTLPSMATVILAVVLTVAVLFPAVASAAVDCGIQPLVLLGNTTTTDTTTTDHAGRVNVQLGEDSGSGLWMSVSIVDDATFVNVRNGNGNGTDTNSLRFSGLDVKIEEYNLTYVEKKTDSDPSSNIIGLGPDSTLIRELYEAKIIPSRSYGLSYDASTLSIDSLVLGGQDRSRYSGSLYESELAEPNGEALNVEVERITLTKEDGEQVVLAAPAANFTATLDNTIDQLVLPSPIAAAFQRAVGAVVADSSHLNSSEIKVPSSTQYGRILRYSKSFGGSLTITLRNGYNATIPSEVLSRSLNTTTEQTVRISAVLEAKSGQTSGVFGAAFLSQAYLSVDYESMKFYLANRANGGNMELSTFGCSVSTSSTPIVIVSATPSTTDRSSSNNGSSTNTHILGPVLGSLIGAIVILIAILFLIKRYKLRKKTEKQNSLAAAAVPTTSSPTSRGLGGSDDKQLGEYNQGISSSGGGVGARRGHNGGLGLEGIRLPTTPSRVSLAPSTMAGTPARNSYFTEDFHDIVRTPPPRS